MGNSSGATVRGTMTATAITAITTVIAPTCQPSNRLATLLGRVGRAVGAGRTRSCYPSIRPREQRHDAVGLARAHGAELHPHATGLRPADRRRDHRSPADAWESERERDGGAERGHRVGLEERPAQAEIHAMRVREDPRPEDDLDRGMNLLPGVLSLLSHTERCGTIGVLLKGWRAGTRSFRGSWRPRPRAPRGARACARQAPGSRETRRRRSSADRPGAAG